MPELPDLEVFAGNLNSKLKGKKLVKVSVYKNAKLNVSAAVLKKSIEDQTLSRVYRQGKELRLLFRNKNVLGVHLMLRGKFFWYEDKNTHGHTLVEWVFSGNHWLALTDYQANARVTLNPDPVKVPDALSKELNSKYLLTILDSRAGIKNLLLDQHLIRGIGNAYADEILWDARISPFSKARKIPAAAVARLARSIKKVMSMAIRKIDKAAPGIIGGEVRDSLLIHNSAKKQSPAGGRIQKKTTGGRPTYFTGEQRLYT